MFAVWCVLLFVFVLWRLHKSIDLLHVSSHISDAIVWKVLQKPTIGFVCINANDFILAGSGCGYVFMCSSTHAANATQRHTPTLMFARPMMCNIRCAQQERFGL